MSEWLDLQLMFEDIKKYPYKVVQNDLPGELKLGYKTIVDDSVWHIQVQLIKGGASKVDPLELFLSTEYGKSKLLDYLNKDK